MNILYGVQATGNGHINRSREVVKELKSRGHSVLTVFSGRDSDKFWDIEDFSPYLMFRGMTFKTKNGRIKHFRTLTNLRLIQFLKDVNGVSKLLKDYDLVVSDYEPLSLRAAKKANKFSINLSHQACFHYNNIPTKRKEPLGVLITKNFAKGDLNIGVHWDRFHETNIIIPPIVPSYLKDKKIDKKCLVYLPFENISTVVKTLSNISSYYFYVYADEKFDDRSNVFSRSFSREGFLNDLQECEAVISNAGFELISEALYLGRKIIVKPVINQMEQESNAKCVEKLGIGKSIKKLKTKQLEQFLTEGQTKKIIYPQSQKLFVDWLEEKDFDKKRLMESVWR